MFGFTSRVVAGDQSEATGLASSAVVGPGSPPCTSRRASSWASASTRCSSLLTWMERLMHTRSRKRIPRANTRLVPYTMPIALETRSTTGSRRRHQGAADGDADPEQRVALREAPAPHDLDHDGEEEDDDDQEDELEPHPGAPLVSGRRSGVHEDDEHQPHEVVGAPGHVVGRPAAHALPHGDRHLDDLEIPVLHQEERLDRVGQVGGRVGLGEPLDGDAVEGPEPAGRVGDASAEAPRDDAGQRPHAEPPQRSDAVVAGPVAEAGAEHHVGLT